LIGIHHIHVTLEVVKIAILSGLDLLILPSYTSHALQPLDASCFKPFKVAIRGFRDNWTLNHRGQSPPKEELTTWILFALKRTLTEVNICKGFKATGIYTLNIEAIDGKFSPSVNFQSKGGKGCSRKVAEGGCSSPIDSGGLQRWQVEEV